MAAVYLATMRRRFQLPTLRSRLLLGAATMLLPPALLIALGVVVLNDLTGRLAHLMEEVTHEIHPLVRLEALLLRTSTLLESAAAEGEATNRDRYARQAGEVSAAFRSILDGPLHVPGARLNIESAASHWQEAVSLAAPHFDRDSAPGVRATARKRIAARIDEAASLLYDVRMLAKRNIEDEFASALSLRDQVMLLMAALLVAVLVIAILGCLALMRAVFRPLSVMAHAADRLAKGDFTHPVEHTHMPRELQRLAQAFNAMATKIKEDLAQLEALASRDGLTGLFNHRTFYAMLDGELARSRRFAHPLSLLLIDIDHFKRVNDTFGHQAGDAALKTLGELLVRETRAVDRVARYGGEELAVLLPETDANRASSVAERIRGSVQAGAFGNGDGKPIPLTVSVGVASFPAHADDTRSLVAAADTALYAGKQGGRNRVVLAGEEAR